MCGGADAPEFLDLRQAGAGGAQRGFLYESVSDMQTGYMPPRNYLLVHPEAKVTPERADDAQGVAQRDQPDPAPARRRRTAASDAEYREVAGAARCTRTRCPRR